MRSQARAASERARREEGKAERKRRAWSTRAEKRAREATPIAWLAASSACSSSGRACSGAALLSSSNSASTSDGSGNSSNEGTASLQEAEEEDRSKGSWEKSSGKALDPKVLDEEDSDAERIENELEIEREIEERAAAVAVDDEDALFVEEKGAKVMERARVRTRRGRRAWKRRTRSRR